MHFGSILTQPVLIKNVLVLWGGFAGGITMSPKQLETLRDFISHHKSKNDKKIMSIAERLPIYEPLHVLAMKVNAAMEHMKQLIENSLSDQCADEDGNIKMNTVLEVVKFRIEYKKENEKEDAMAM